MSPERLAVYQNLFRNLLFNGAVLEYDGGENWYDVHPAIQAIGTFCEAMGHEEA